MDGSLREEIGWLEDAARWALLTRLAGEVSRRAYSPVRTKSLEPSLQGNWKLRGSNLSVLMRLRERRLGRLWTVWFPQHFRRLLHVHLNVLDPHNLLFAIGRVPLLDCNTAIDIHQLFELEVAIVFQFPLEMLQALLMPLRRLRQIFEDL